MGEASTKRTRNQRLLESSPYCVYCGGATPATTVDHAPPISLFDLKRRPEGLEFAACAPCHEGTRKIDLVAALITRSWPPPASSLERRELEKLMREVLRRVPTVAADFHTAFGSSPPLSPFDGQGAHEVEFGPAMKATMEAFCARMAFALSAAFGGSIVPPNGGVSVVLFPNGEVDQLPRNLFDTFSLNALMQSGLTAHESFQFGLVEQAGHRYCMMIFRKSILALAHIVSNADEEHLAIPEVFRPGFLIGYPL